MAVPTFQDIMLPLLEILSDGNEWTLSQLEERLSKHFELTEEERPQVTTGEMVIDLMMSHNITCATVMSWRCNC